VYISKKNHSLIGRSACSTLGMTRPLSFLVKTSTIPGAGDGLFACEDIEADTFMYVRHSRPVSALRRTKLFVMNYYIDDIICDDAICVCEGKQRKLNDIKSSLHASVFLKRYVAGKDDFMNANDFAWPSQTQKKYNANSLRNQLEFVMVVEAGQLVGIAAHFLCKVAKGEEIGCTYGWDFWADNEREVGGRRTVCAEKARGARAWGGKKEKTATRGPD
jgi:hypothetical protein